MNRSPAVSSPDLMAAIVAASRVRAAALRGARLRDLERRAGDRMPRAALFAERLGRPGINVIAECKRRSPLKGVLCRRYDAPALASAYEHAGAAAISVLTEPAFFHGCVDDLCRARAAVAVPVLRKDFIVDERQIVEARAAGADAVLLIVRVLHPPELSGLLRTANALGLATLLEVHDREDLERALGADGRIVGVNARDLRSMQVDLATAVSLGSEMPADVVRVAESGIRTPADVERLSMAGYQAFLVGEHLMTSGDPGAALAALVHS